MVQPARQRRWPHWAWFAFPVSLWLLGVWFHGADLGKYCDDYHFGPYRDHAVWSQKYTWLFPFVFRPLFRIELPVLERVLWDHDAIHHAIHYLAHACNAVLLVRLLAKLGFSRHARLACGVLFWLHPACFEFHFWVSALATTLAIGCALGALNVSASFMRDPRPRMLACIFVLAACVPCFNEQPASLLAMIPFLAYALAPRGARFPRGGSVLLVAAIPCAIYILLQRATMPDDWPGAANRYLSPDQLPARTWEVLLSCFRSALLWRFGSALLPIAWEAMAQHPIRACVLMACVACCAIALARVWHREARELPGENALSSRSLAMLALGAGVCLVASAIPVALLKGYSYSFRNSFAACFALALWCAILAEWLLRRTPVNSHLTFVVRAGAGLIVGLGITFAVLLLGAQQALRERWLADERLAQELRRVYPELPSWACVVPFENLDHGPRAGLSPFSSYFLSALGAVWPSRGFVRREYDTPEVWASWSDPLGHRGHWNPTGDGIEVFPPLDIWYKPPGPQIAPDWVFPWSHVAGVVIDERGTIRRVREVVVRDRSGGWIRHHLPLGEGGVTYVWR
jgi:hypothetical protein